MTVSDIKAPATLAGVIHEYAHFFTADSLSRTVLLAGGSTGPDGMSGTPDSLDKGLAGLALGLLALYEHEQNRKLLDAADVAIWNMLDHCKSFASDRYSLYTGRAGVAYVLLQRYKIESDAIFLTEAVELMTPANGTYLHSDYTPDGLFEGRAGTLLVLLHLYLHTGPALLQNYINEYVAMILARAEPCGGGLCWNLPKAGHFTEGCGFAHGAAGIRFVLGQVYLFCKNPALQHAIRLTGRYIDSCYSGETGGWGDYRTSITDNETLEAWRYAYRMHPDTCFLPGYSDGWANGASGILSSQELLTADYGGYGYTERKAMAARVLERIGRTNDSNGGLYSGLAGILLSLSACLHAAVSPVQLIEKTGSKHAIFAGPRFFAGGLFHGELGNLYALIRLSQKTSSGENILRPFAGQVSVESAQARHPLTLSVPLAKFRKDLLGHSYPRTLVFLSGVAKEAASAILESHADAANDDAAVFEIGVRAWLTIHHDTPGAKQVEDILNLEKERRSLFLSDRRPRLQRYLDSLMANETALAQLNKPDEWLDGQYLALGPRVSVVYTLWDWKYIHPGNYFKNQELQQRHAANLNLAPGKYEYLLMEKAELVDIEPLHTDWHRMVLQLFEGRRTPDQARIDLQRVAGTISEERLMAVLKSLNIGALTSKTELWPWINKMFGIRIRQFLHLGIMQIKRQ